MSWLKLDDGFTKHPKFAGWTAPQKWAWLEVMEYCARYETAGRIPDDLSIMPRSTTPALLKKAEKAGWIDRADDGGQVIHDFPLYNSATVGERVAYYLAQHPDASANDVAKGVVGTRELVLAEVARIRGGSEGGSETGSGEPPFPGSAEPAKPVRADHLNGGSESGSRTRAARPVPSLEDQKPSFLPAEAKDPAPEQEGRRNLLDEDRIHPFDLIPAKPEF